MTGEEYDRYVEDNLGWQAKSIITQARNHERNRSTVLAICDAVSMAYPEADFHFTGASVSGVRNFARMAEVIQFLDDSNIVSLYKWTSYDYPESRNRDFVCMLPSGANTFRVSLYAAEDSECKLVEVSRETVEKVKYKLLCGDENAEANAGTN